MVVDFNTPLTPVDGPSREAVKQQRPRVIPRNSEAWYEPVKQQRPRVIPRNSEAWYVPDVASERKHHNTHSFQARKEHSPGLTAY